MYIKHENFPKYPSESIFTSDKSVTNIIIFNITLNVCDPFSHDWGRAVNITCHVDLTVSQTQHEVCCCCNSCLSPVDVSKVYRWYDRSSAGCCMDLWACLLVILLLFLTGDNVFLFFGSCRFSPGQVCIVAVWLGSLAASLPPDEWRALRDTETQLIQVRGHLPDINI